VTTNLILGQTVPHAASAALRSFLLRGKISSVMQGPQATPRASVFLGRASLVAGVAAIAAALSLGTAEAEPQAQGPDISQARERADTAAAMLGGRLMNELTEAMQHGGPVNGVRVCSEIAQEVTRTLGSDNDLVLKRTSLKTRNPANAPDDFERAWLERAEAAVAAKRAPEAVYEVGTAPAGGRELRHLRPIIFPGGVCSQCHGLPEQIAPEVRELLRQRYPDDHATGFKPGDLRGAISVRLALPDAGAAADE
jgi:hypothetical protein